MKRIFHSEFTYLAIVSLFTWLTVTLFPTPNSPDSIVSFIIQGALIIEPFWYLVAMYFLLNTCIVFGWRMLMHKLRSKSANSIFIGAGVVLLIFSANIHDRLSGIPGGSLVLPPLEITQFPSLLPSYFTFNLVLSLTQVAWLCVLLYTAFTWWKTKSNNA